MYTNLKKKIENEFDKDANYNIIISKIERKKDMNSKKINYILVPTYALLIVIVGFIGLEFQLREKDILIDKINVGEAIDEEYKENENDLIKINEYFITNMVDIDAKMIEVDLKTEFNFLKNIYIPQYLNNIKQGKIYVRSNINDANYSIFKQYSITFFDNSEPEGKCVSIDFSKNELLPDCVPSNIDSAEESTIDGIKVKLFAVKQKNDSTKIQGEAYFEYEDYKFDIKVYRITKDDFIQIIKSIIKEIKLEDLPI